LPVYSWWKINRGLEDQHVDRLSGVDNSAQLIFMRGVLSVAVGRLDSGGRRPDQVC
jgi:hypothetical protein